MKKHYLVLVSAACLAIVFAVGSYVYKNQQTKKLSFMANEKASTFIREHAQTLGSDDAKVYIIEFFDPAGETCRAYYNPVKDLMTANPGRIKLVMRYAPFHAGSDYFVKILEAGRKQGKYWETLEVMYRYQPKWASHRNPQPQLIWQYLSKAGLDVDQIRKDMYDPAIAKLIEQDLADAKTLSVRKTPGFFVNGKPLPSFGYNQLIELVKTEINANY